MAEKTPKTEASEPTRTITTKKWRFLRGAEHIVVEASTRAEAYDKLYKKSSKPSKK